MQVPNQRIRIMAGTPIEAGDYRLLPSVLVKTMEHKGESGRFFTTNLRPISVVAEGPKGTRWHEIPNETGQTLSIMAAIAAGIAAGSLLLIGLVRLLRRLGG